MESVRSYDSTNFGLPQNRGGSALASRQTQESRNHEGHFLLIRADAVRRLDRGEPEPEAITSRSSASEEAPETSSEAPY